MITKSTNIHEELTIMPGTGWAPSVNSFLAGIYLVPPFIWVLDVAKQDSAPSGQSLVLEGNGKEI